MRGPLPPAVLFFDDDDWDCFLQLAARLRRAGITTIRATTVRPGRAVSGTRTIFDRTLVLARPGDTAELRELANRHQILDIQTTEPVAGLAYGFATDLAPPHCLETWAGRPDLIDKLSVSELLAAAGIRVPETIPAAGADLADVVRRLGLPLIMKHRVGSAGRGVQVVHDAAELTAAAALPGADERFYERFVTGRSVRFGCLATEDGVQISGTWKMVRRSAPLAPATVVEFVDEPQVAASGRSIVAATGMRGLLNLQFLLDSDGHHWLHDVNPRAWGAYEAFQTMGTDLGAGYINWLLGKPVVRSHVRAGPPGNVLVFPLALRSLLPEPRARAAYLRWLWSRRGHLGLGYAFLELVRNRSHLLPRSAKVARA